MQNVAKEKTYRIQSDVYHHGLVPNKHIKNSHWGPLKYDFYTNSLGFRDKAVRDIPLVSDRYRMVFIGDSFTEGVGMAYEDTFVGLIDAALASEGVEVFNAACQSYSPVVYWTKTRYLLEDVGLKFDELVVFLDISDVSEEAPTTFLNEGHDIKEGATPIELDPESKVKGLKAFFRNNTIFTYYVLQRLYSIFHHHGMNQKIALWTVDRDVYEEYGERGIKRMKLHMNKLSDLLKENDIRLTVAVYPWIDQIMRDDRDSIHVSIWEAWCQEHDAYFINYFPHFVTGNTYIERKRIIDKYYIRGDTHLSPDAHRLNADVFVDLHRAYQKTVIYEEILHSNEVKRECDESTYRKTF